MTAALGLYQVLRLPLPWQAATERLPLIIYGGASAVGAFAIKLAVLSNIHPIVAVAGNGTEFVNSLLDPSKGDVVVDYRKGDDHVVEQLRQAAGPDVKFTFDAVSEKGSIANLDKVLVKGGKIATVLTPNMVVGGRADSDHAEILFTLVGTVHTDVPKDAQEKGVKLGDRVFGSIFFPFLGQGLQEGWFKGHPWQVVEGGLGGLQNALGLLRDGKLSARKAVLRIGEH